MKKVILVALLALGFVNAMPGVPSAYANIRYSEAAFPGEELLDKINGALFNRGWRFERIWLLLDAYGDTITANEINLFNSPYTIKGITFELDPDDDTLDLLKEVDFGVWDTKKSLLDSINAAVRGTGLKFSELGMCEDCRIPKLHIHVDFGVSQTMFKNGVGKMLGVK